MAQRGGALGERVGQRIAVGRDRIPKPLALLLIALAVLLGCSYVPRERSASPMPSMEPCALSIPGSSDFHVQCLDVPVPIDPAQPTGPSMSLHVSLVRVQGRRAEPDPLVVLPPLPGQAASNSGLTEAELRVQVSRDVVLVDQRGTGLSHALRCADADTDTFLSGPRRIERLSSCASQLDADPRLFTTPSAVADLERVRQTLGYERWNLSGHGYGARVAIEYAQSYPEHVRALVLEAPDMRGSVAGSNQAALANTALQATLQGCARATACNQAFANLASDTNRLLEDLRVQPRLVPLSDDATGASASLMVNPARVDEAALFASGDQVGQALLPLMLHDAASGNLRPLAVTLARLASQRRSLLSEGAAMAIRCMEDLPSAGAGVGVDEAEVCSSWPGEETRPANSYASIDVPTLLLAAGGDVLADPARLDRSLEALPRSRMLVLGTPTRQPSRNECLARLTATFVDLGSADSLDTGCLQTEPGPRFFVSTDGLER